MSDADDSPPPGGRKKRVKTKRVLRRSNTQPSKQIKQSAQPSVTLPHMEANFANQFHTLDNNVDDPGRTAEQLQMERKLARLRSQSKRTVTQNQRRSAPTTPRKRQSSQPARPTFQPASVSDGFDDPFFTSDPFQASTPMSAPDIMATQPAAPSRQTYQHHQPRRSVPTTVPIAQEHVAPQTVALAPPADMKPKARETRANTLPTLPMSNTSNMQAPIATEGDQFDEFEAGFTSDPFDALVSTTTSPAQPTARPALKDDDSSDLSMFYSYSAPASRRTSQTRPVERPFVPYVHPVGADASGRSSLVYVPVQVPVYNVAGGVPYAQIPAPAAAAQAGAYAYPNSAPMVAQQWVPPPTAAQPVNVAQPMQRRQYPMTPPAQQVQRRW